MPGRDGSDPAAALLQLGRIIDERLSSCGRELDEIRPGLLLGRIEAPMGPTAVVYPGAVCLVAQGSKRVRFGGEEKRYGDGRFLLSAMDLPAESEILDASPSHPLLSLVLTLDMGRLATVAAELRDVVHLDGARPPAPLGSHPVDEPLAASLVRLVRAATVDLEWSFLSEGLQREVYYRLLTGPGAGALLTRLQSAGAVDQVTRAIEFIKMHLTEPIDIETLARTAGLSTSGLHSKFKQVTTLSPMQYVKRLRLDRANAMIVAGEPVTTAAFAVGYASPSQFSRDFKRQYGAPPSSVARAS